MSKKIETSISCGQNPDFKRVLLAIVSDFDFDFTGGLDTTPYDDAEIILFSNKIGAITAIEKAPQISIIGIHTDKGKFFLEPEEDDSLTLTYREDVFPGLKEQIESTLKSQLLVA